MEPTTSLSLSLTQPLVSMKQAGLDPLYRTFLKLFIKDITSLDQCAFKEVDTPAFCFHGHVLVKVDIMGFIVKVDLRDKKHAYVVDDGTAVILCNLWKNHRQELPAQVNDLPNSLLQKQLEVTSSYDEPLEGFDLGDLVCVRGRVVVFAGQKEIDILDMFRLDNPNCELQRVLGLPSMHSTCYKQPFTLPEQISETFTNSESTVSADGLKSIVLKHIEQSADSLRTFSIDDVLSWPSIHSLKSNADDDGVLTRSGIKSALWTLSDSEGLICKRCDLMDEFEVVKEGCGLTIEVFRIMKTLFQAKQSDGMGSHVNHIHRLLRNSSRYADVSLTVLQKAVQCLENTSDVIKVDAHRYIPLS